MDEIYKEIAFEAEISTAEHPELQVYAQEMCNEDINTRSAVITELRKMIFDRGECQPLRTDDAFLLRFLRSRNFIVPRAHKLLVRYCDFREQYSHLYQDVDIWGLAKVKDAYIGTMYDRPDVGRISICRVGKWDPNDYPIEDLIRAGLAMIEMGFRQPKVQVFGSTFIVDLEGITMRHVASMTPVIAYQIVCVLGLAVPTRMRACHIINYSWFFNTFFYLYKKVVPAETWSKIYFHGSDLNSLHQHIDPQCLPPEYGGTSQYVATPDVWLSKIRKYMTDDMVKDLKKLGYIVKE